MDFRLRPFRADHVPTPRESSAILELARGHEGLDLEIGCGVGMHAIRYARENPRRFLVAVERTQEKFRGFASRLAHHEALPNLLALRDDAVSIVTHAIPAGALDRVFLLYPNPYPKESQANKRWPRMPFLTRLHASLKSGGTLTLATNEAFYAAEAREWLTGLGLFDLATDREFRLADVGSIELPVARTHFEKKYLRAGQSVYDLTFIAR
ncbi:MAG TPA: SAM-dependent methyltransferase [Bdellovibrionota bacterium]|nr:SAM-dependent methyltransferase [Bdellovibrionota bacterium]